MKSQGGIKDLKPTSNGKFKQGYFQLKHPEKYMTNVNEVIYRSSWEHRFMIYCDSSEEVLQWASEPFYIQYFYGVDQKVHKYYPDFYFARRNEDGTITKYIVEVKPTEMLKKPEPPKRKTPNTMRNYNVIMEQYTKNYYKSIAAKDWCAKNGYKFVYLTENSKLF